MDEQDLNAGDRAPQDAADSESEPASHVDMLTAALDYAEQALRIFPLWWVRDGKCACPAGAACGSPGKHPRISSWKTAATDNAAIIRQWWAHWPDAGIGLPTGEINRIVVVDIDGADGEQSIADAGGLPAAPTVITGRGLHVYFSADSAPTMRNAAGLRPGVDVRANGGYVVAPPTLHVSGPRYAWVEGLGLGTPLPPLPAWLAEPAARRPSAAHDVPPPPRDAAPNGHAHRTREDRYAQSALALELAAVRSAQEGTRNETLNNAALKLGSLSAGGLLNEGTVRAALLDAAIACGLGEREALRTIESGITKGMQSPRGVPPPSHGEPHVSAADSRTDWSDPTPLPTMAGVPAWNERLLPESLRPWLSDAIERTQCPAEYVAVGAIVTLASVIGRQCAIRPKRRDDWTIVPNLWGAIVGPPSAMKSPALHEAMRPILQLAGKASKAYADVSSTRDELEAKFQAAKDKLRKAAQRGEDTSAAATECNDLRAELAKAHAERRYVVYDSTTEKLGEILNANRRGVLLFRDELVGWLSSLDKQGHESDRAFYLEAWTGTGEFVYDRIARGTVRIEAACVSVLGGIQPGPLGRYLNEAVGGGHGADGLMQRFQLMVYPDPPRDWLSVDRWPDSDARRRVVDLFTRLSNLCREDTGARIDEPGEIPYVRFAPDAQEAFGAWLAALMRRVRMSDEHEALQSHLIKYASLMPSLALVFELAEGGTDFVRLPAAELALEWCSVLEAHARRVYASCIERDMAAARALLERLRAGKVKDKFAARDVYRCQWKGLTDPEVVERAIGILDSYGWVRLELVKTPGRPGQVAHVHPSLLAPKG
jgi:putative DNA primase/helicase